jgi:hypothetical protein
MSYRRYRPPQQRDPVATVATTATKGRDAAESVATVAVVARPSPFDFDERSAIVEHDGGVARAWAEGFARLSVSRPPVGFSYARWRELLDDGGRFVDRWAEIAAAQGWSAADIFGLSPHGPATRYDGMGLVALIRGGEVTEITSEHATIRAPSGNCLTYYLRRPRPEAVAVWDLVAGRDVG